MSSLTENVHRLTVRAVGARVLPEIIKWGEAPWWPKGSRMRFVRTTSGAIAVGTRYRQEVLLPFAPSWEAEVTEITDHSITRRFLNGMFEGSETVALAPQGPDTEVCYEMRVRLNGAMNRLLWPLMFRRMHDANIR